MHRAENEGLFGKSQLGRRPAAPGSRLASVPEFLVEKRCPVDEVKLPSFIVAERYHITVQTAHSVTVTTQVKQF